MRTMFRGSAGLTIALAGAIGFFASTHLTRAAQLKEAQVTQIVKDVKLLPGQAAARPAALKDNVAEGTAVRTGDESRTELTFTDQTLARLGANTLFSFQGGTRNLDLGGGAALLSVPKDARGATVRTAAVTAAVSGGTSALEHHGNAYCKFICLEGTLGVSLKNIPGESVILHPGQMLITPPNPKHLPAPVTIDLERFVNSCILITDFPPLANQPLIAEAIAQQRHEKAEGNLVESNQVILEDGDLVTLVDPTLLDTIDQKTNAAGGAPAIAFNPIKFGPLPTITAPIPYVINSGTFIQTDPFIQTDGATDFGRIYRGNAADGLPADYFFGSASAFDVTIFFNGLSENPANLPIAAFKFTSLQLAGNPAISLGTGGATSLVLISEGGITSGVPGGTLTFPNLSLVLLATQNGSITLGNTISFANMPNLRFYARGAGSNLTLASPMTNMGSVNLTAEGSVQVNADEGVQFFNSFAGVDFLTGTGLISASGSINIGALGTVNFSMAQFSIGNGASVFLGSNITGTVTIDASANPTLFVSAANLQVLGANINVTGGTTMTFGNLTNASFTTLTGSISAGTMRFFHPGGLLDMTSAGDINAQSILGGGSISANGGITVTADLSSRLASAGGDINVTGTLTNTQLTSGTNITAGNLISGDVEAFANVNAGQVSVLLLNANVISSPTVLTAGAGGIIPYAALPPGSPHFFTVSTVQSHTAPIGIDFSGNATGAAGGILTINAASQNFGVLDGINGANFNGGQPGQSGGSLTVNAAGAIHLLNQTPTTNNAITATSGIINAGGPSGNGGSVTLNAGDELDIQNSTIQVSSGDAAGTPNRRSSKTGGNITITNRGTTTTTAILVDNTSQLLSLLEAATPTGGLIKIEATQATGASHISVTNGPGGRIEATNGGIDIRHFSSNGVIDVTNASMIADVIKIAALGDSSTLNIGGGIVSATTLLRLYAGNMNSNNSTINFLSSVQLNGNRIDIVAHTVNITAGATVTTSSLANVYTSNANYGIPGTGQFGGVGATTFPQVQAPPIGNPGQGP